MSNQFPEANKVLVGKQDHLFLTNDSNRTIDQITGKIAISSAFVEEWTRLFSYRLRRYLERGTRCILSIAPMKEVVYSQYLPDGIQLAQSGRVVDAVITAAVATGMPLYYAASELRALSKIRPAYPTGDTHWTSAAAYAAYATTVRAVGFNPIGESALIYKERHVTGDLASKIGKLTTRYEFDLVSPAAKLVFDNGIEGTGSLKSYENTLRSGRCVVFRDSFCGYPERMFAETFARTTLVWQPNFDHAVIAQERPDVIISLMAERFLLEVPNDHNGPTNNQLAERKHRGLGSNLSAFRT